ncbi:hypothetical protein JW905_07170 [bacterium]|nr:hypothetical protein [candidate division CSSED10-310 bacterium]
MKSLLQLLGFPPPEKRDGVRFLLARNLSYGTRISLIIILLAIGFSLQLLLLIPWFGLPFLIAAMLLSLVHGYDSRARLTTFKVDSQWRTVPISKFIEMEDLRKKNQRWDRDALDISNSFGCFVFVLLLAASVIVSYVLEAITGDPDIALIFFLDWIILVISLWFTGMKFILKQANLEIKVKLVLDLYKAFADLKQDGEEFKPALMLSHGKAGASVPVDARFAVSLPGQPEGLYGLQAQINLNVVQGHSYPYFYCVIAAKPGFGLKRFHPRVKLPDKVICEYQEDANAEVLVIRQHTTKKSGYHTKDKTCIQILDTALHAARMIIA